ncbi:MAG: HAD-IA family hydrolase [Bacteroidales bacterium]|nr:HAD-IA family hydrolase [Bacteroidales bacterium]
MKIQGVVFDFDGTIADTEPLWQRAELEILATEGIVLTETEVTKTKGLAPLDAVSYWCNRAGKTVKSPALLTHELTEAVINLLKTEGELMPGIIETLEFWKSKALPMGIASGSSMKHIKTILDKFDLNKYFNLIYSADFERFGKPHPGIFISACKKLKIDPLFSVAFEDSFNGILSAKAARMKVVALLSDGQINDTKFDFADLKIESLINFGATEFNLLESLL